jgi:hypothetical protein
MKFFLLTATALYLSLHLVIFTQGEYYEYKLDQFDLDGSGFFEANEQTPDQHAAMRLLVNDTGRALAPFTLIPVALVVAGLVMGVRAIWKSV